MKSDYSVETCNEVAEILDHIPKTLYDMLPKEVINYFYQNADIRNKHFEYNVALPILEQHVSQEAKKIIVFLFIIFWKKEVELIKFKKSYR